MNGSEKPYLADEDPYLFAAALLRALCRLMSDQQRAAIARALLDDANDMNEAGKSADDLRFGRALASLAALMEGGVPAALSVVNAGRLL